MKISNLFAMIVEKFTIVIFYLFVLVTVYVFVNAVIPGYSLLISSLISLILLIIIIKNKEIINTNLNSIVNYFSKYSKSKLIMIIILILISERILVLLLFNFPTFLYGDTNIYVSFANFISFGIPMEYQYSYPHLFYTGLYLSIFNLFKISYIDGMFLLFVLSIIIYFVDFSKVIGKSKSFFAVLLYILMPSSIFWTYSVTHEMFYFFFTSIIFYFLFDILISNKLKLFNTIIILILLILNLSVNPIATILLIALSLSGIMFYKGKIINKILFSLLLIATIIISPQINSVLSKKIIGYEVVSAPFQSNLLVGSSIESGGRYDSNLLQEVSEEIKIRGLQDSNEAYKDISWEFTVKNYEYLITHPIDLIKLLFNKFYIAWSGDHYSLEMLLNYNATFKLCPSVTNILQIIMLSISTLIYLFVVCIGTLKNKDYDGNSSMNFTKTLLIGIVLALLIIEIMNKYSVHSTILIFMVAVSRIKNISID